MKKELYINRNVAWGDVYEVFMSHKNIATGKRFIYTKPKLVEHDISSVPERLVMLDREEAQQLMDELWNAGIRPAGATGSIGQLSAVQYHLEDMRKLVFK